MSELDYLEFDKMMRKIEAVIIENEQLKRKLANIDPLLRRLVESGSAEDAEKARREFDERCKTLSAAKALIKAIEPYILEGIDKLNVVKGKVAEVKTRYLDNARHTMQPDDHADLISSAALELDALKHEMFTISIAPVQQRIVDHLTAEGNAAKQINEGYRILEADKVRLRQLGGDNALRKLKYTDLTPVPQIG